MKVYFDTGILIDILATGPFGVLRTQARRGRSPAELARDAEVLLSLVAERHSGLMSAFSLYELEEAMVRATRGPSGRPGAGAIRLSAARPLLEQGLILARRFAVEVLPLGEGAFQAVHRAGSQGLGGLRIADAVHVAMAVEAGAEAVVSADRAVLRLDGRVANGMGQAVRFCDTDGALALL